jgi:hypothetical protein
MKHLVPALNLSSSLALACSGEGAGDVIRTSSLIGLAALLFSFAATIGSVVRARRLKAKAPAIIAVVLLLIHPTVWLGVSSGDCGYTLRLAGPMVAALHAGVLGFLLIKKSEAS